MTARQPQTKKDESDSSSSDDEEVDQKKPNGMIHTAMKVPKPSHKREDKAYRKQRKQIRKMIRRQMMDHSREVIQSLI